MINRIKLRFASKDNKRLLSNFFSLSVLQGANYILPLITLPYLVRVLGVEYFGLLAFATATVTYFNIITDYGFNLTGTREISIHRNDKDKVTEIFSSIMTIKFLLMFLSFILLSILILSFKKFSNDWVVYFLSFGTVIGQVLFPVWFFQGMERMKYITYLNILAKSIFTVSIFIFVQEKNDFWIVPLLTSIGFIIAGFWSLILVRKEFNIFFKWQNKDRILFYAIDGWQMFLINITTSIYTISNIFLLGIIGNNMLVGYYSAAEKLIKPIQYLMQPIFQTTYPYISNKMQQSKENTIIFLKKLYSFTFIFTLILSCFVFFYSQEIIFLFYGEEYKNSVLVLKILSFLPLVGNMNNAFGIQTLQNMGLQRVHLKIIRFSTILFIVVAIVLVPTYHHIGSAISLIFVEALIPMIMFFYLQTKQFKILG